MSEINFKCPHCQQDLTASDEFAGQEIECPACQQPFTVPGGIGDMPSFTPPPTMTATGDADKGKTVRIELPPEFLNEPEKHIFKIKRIQR